MTIVERLNGLYSRGRLLSVCLLFLLLSVVMMLIVAPAVQSATGLPPLDVRFGYTADDVAQFFQALGPEGISTYHAMWGLDIVYPAAYGMGAMMAMAVLGRRLFSPDSQLQWIMVVPLAAMLMDYVENVCLLILSLSPTSVNPLLAAVASGATITKWVLIIITVLALLVELVAHLIMSRRGEPR